MRRGGVKRDRKLDGWRTTVRLNRARIVWGNMARDGKLGILN